VDDEVHAFDRFLDDVQVADAPSMTPMRFSSDTKRPAPAGGEVVQRADRFAACEQVSTMCEPMKPAAR